MPALSTPIDTHILEILASKICHDLISPIGAVNNGVELIEDMGPDAGPEATALIAFSAQQASAKLQAYRIAYGVGGADPTIKPEDVYKTIELIISHDKKIRQDWNPNTPLGINAEGERPKGFSKMLICAILLGMECLPKGGAISVVPGNGAEAAVIAKGENAGLRGQSAEALALKLGVHGLDPKYVHAYMTGLLAKHYGFTLAANDSEQGFISITIKA
jgi:histidine phosphotransferase ChpT